jgi:hypothetical protein
MNKKWFLSMIAGQALGPTKFFPPLFRTRILPYTLFIGSIWGNFRFFSFFSFKFVK